MKYQISKDFFCDYGHRVWTQELKEEFCSKGDTSCKCKHLHGHTGKVTVELGSDILTKGFVTDFKHLGFVKDYIDENFDHKFIIDRNDPLFKALTNGFKHTHHLEVDDMGVGHFVDELIEDFKDQSIKFELLKEQDEYIKSFSVVSFVPTSENLAAWMFDFVKYRIGHEAEVISVTWQETPKSKAIYYGK